MADPLRRSDLLLKTHIGKIEVLLQDAVAFAKVRLDREVAGTIVAFGIGASEGCERTARNMGRDAYLAPFVHLSAGLWAWLGYREEWQDEGRSNSFRSASLTIHFGYKFISDKPQMFRAEWAGLAQWSGSSYLHAAGDAAHPHWQFDALESIRQRDAIERASEFLSVLQAEADETPHEFTPHGVSPADVLEVVGHQQLSRIHFASAAPWWLNAPNDVHTHAPEKVEQVQNWLSKTLSYVRRELVRLSSP